MPNKFRYVEYDEIGAKFIKCMLCDRIVAERFYKEIKIRSAPARIEKVLSLQKLDQYRQIRVALSDGSYMEPIVCSTCANNIIVDRDIDPSVTDDLIEKEAEAVRAFDLYIGKSIAAANDAYNQIKKLVALKKISRDRTWRESHIESVGIAKEFKEKKV